MHHREGVRQFLHFSPSPVSPATGCACNAEVAPDLVEREAAAMSDDDIIEEAHLLAELNDDPSPCELAIEDQEEPPSTP